MIGQVVDGKYRVEELLGRGGMGAVYRAVHLGTDRMVALKVIAPALASSPAYVERFRREARACGRLRHPNIVDVTDFGVCGHEGRQLAYLVMEFLDGCTLADVLQETTPPLPWVVEILEQTSSAVEDAHRHGILHRDLKPDNIWLEPNRRGGYSVKVLDFGLARLEGGGAGGRAAGDDQPAAAQPVAIEQDATFISPAVTRTPASSAQAAVTGVTHASSGPEHSAVTGVAGTPGYMSPEQARAGEVTAQSDVYSLGVIAYRMLAGREPFTGSVTEVIAAHINAPPVPLREVRAEVPQDAADLIMAALSKDPAGRPPSAGAFGNMLAGQLESPAGFFTRSGALFVQRLPAFMTIAAACFVPALLWSVVFAIWSVAHTLSPDVSAPQGLPLGIAIAILAAFISVGLLALSVLPLVVLHTIAAPMRPLDVGAMLRGYESRIRRWLAGMLPFLWPRVASFSLLIVTMVLMSTVLRPWIRSFDHRPTRALVVIAVFAPAFLAIGWVSRREWAGMQGGLLLVPVMLVEGLGFDEARARAQALSSTSGRLQRAVRTYYLVGLLLLTTGTTLLFLRARLPGPVIAALTPLAVAGVAVLATFGTLTRSLLYFTARRATGESLERVFEDFERHALPSADGQRTHGDRLRDELTRKESRDRRTL